MSAFLLVVDVWCIVDDAICVWNGYGLGIENR